LIVVRGTILGLFVNQQKYAYCFLYSLIVIISIIMISSSLFSRFATVLRRWSLFVTSICLLSIVILSLLTSYCRSGESKRDV